jgi:hypothetical protein
MTNRLTCYSACFVTVALSPLAWAQLPPPAEPPPAAAPLPAPPTEPASDQPPAGAPVPPAPAAPSAPEPVAPATPPPAASPPLPATSLSAVSPEKTQAAGVEGAPPKKLAVGSSGLFQPGLTLQGWFVLDHLDHRVPGGFRTTTTFRLRRAEISAKGEILPGLVSYAVMIDPARALEFGTATVPVNNQDPPPTGAAAESVNVKQPVGSSSILQDFFITFQSPLVDASIGQFKIPVSWEGYNSSQKLLFPERALVSREYGDKRDLGVRLAKTFEYVGFSAGMFNGAGQNNLDTNNAKDLALRLEAYPVSGLVLAGVIYGSVGKRRTSAAKARWEGDFRFEHGPFLFQGEFIRALDVSAAGARWLAQGFYGAVGWTFAEMLQPVVRLGYLDPNIHTNLQPVKATDKDEVWVIEGGVNYYLRKHEAKLQLAYSRFEYDVSNPNNEVIFAAQVGF